MILRRKRWIRGEGLFAVLVTAVGLWNAGRFAFTLLDLLLKHEVPPWVSFACDVAAYAGLLLIPSALLHTLFHLVLERVHADSWKETWPGPHQRHPAALWAKRLGIALIYAPFLVFPVVVRRVHARPGEPGFDQLGGVIKPFASWFVSALVLAALLSVFLARRARESRERRF